VSVSDDARKALELAGEILQRDGWSQGQALDSVGRHCALGAIGVAVQKTSGRTSVDYTLIRDECEDRVMKELQVAAPAFARAIPLWNDDPERTVEDVLLVFKRAAAREETE
jgi:hypothetical protein